MVALLAAYGVGVRGARAGGDHWPTRRTALFAAQEALLLLVVPALIALGRPIELARKALSDNGVARLNRIVRSWPARTLSHPIAGPATLLVLLLLFLTPLPPEVRAHPGALAATQVLLPAVGLVAVPGILLRLHTTVIGPGVHLSAVPTWQPSPLRDQQLSGDVLWLIGEAIDLPLLAWLVVRWIRADEREAAVVDARLDETHDERPWWVVEAERQRDQDAARDRRDEQP